MSRNPVIKGFTTNPTLMRKAGVSDYEAFARKVLAATTDRPVSFEVFADDFASMAEQARTIAAWGPNVNVKIPITNTKGSHGRISGVACRPRRSRSRAHCGTGRCRRAARAALRLVRIISRLTVSGSIWKHFKWADTCGKRGQELHSVRGAVARYESSA